MADVPSRFVRQPTPAERSELIRLRDSGPAGNRARAGAILLSAARVAVPEIVRRLGLSRPTVTHWLRRFDRSGIAGLLDRPRSGRPARISSPRPSRSPPWSAVSGRRRPSRGRRH